jgi:hypothetical protein
MARRPTRAEDNKPIKRSWTVPGDLYNRFMDEAHKAHRDVNSQLVAVLEEYLEQKDKKRQAAL